MRVGRPSLCFASVGLHKSTCASTGSYLISGCLHRTFQTSTLPVQLSHSSPSRRSWPWPRNLVLPPQRMPKDGRFPSVARPLHSRGLCRWIVEQGNRGTGCTPEPPSVARTCHMPVMRACTLSSNGIWRSNRSGESTQRTACVWRLSTRSYGRDPSYSNNLVNVPRLFCLELLCGANEPS